MAMHLAPGDPSMIAATGPYLGYVGHLVDPNPPEDRKPETATLTTFTEEMHKRSRADLTKVELTGRLKQPSRTKAALLTDFTLDADREVFDLKVHAPQLKEPNELTIQPKYRLRLWIVATDNNIEGGPRTSESKERFSFIVVSETDLLAEIAKEIEGLHLKLEQMQNKLKDSHTKLKQVITELDDKEFLKAQGSSEAEAQKTVERTYSALGTRVLEIGDVVGAGAITAREGHTDFKRIIREEEVNRINPNRIDKERHVAKLLDLVLNQEFVRAEDAQRDFQKALDAKKTDKKLAAEAREKLEELIRRVDEILGSMDQLVNIGLLVKKLQKIEETQRDNVALFRYWKELLEKELLKDLDLDADTKKP
jgi:hypothetical protein